MPKYVVAVKRAKRRDVPANWLELVCRIPGVTLEGSVTSERAQINTEQEILTELQRTIGDYCHIEPIVLHHRSGG